MTEYYDVVVVGSGNAALSAALAAHETGKSVIVLERAPEKARGGNSFFTGGLMRFTYEGVEDMVGSFPELGGDEVAEYVLEPYSELDFFDDLLRVTDMRTDPDLADLLTGKARETVEWSHSKGVRFTWALGVHSTLIDGKQHFWGAAPVYVSGGGEGLVETLFNTVKREGIEVRFQHRVVQLLGTPGGKVEGVLVETGPGQRVEIHAGGVALAAGGFQANAEMRARYLGKNWDLAKVRGTEYNTGDGIQIALDFGAQSYGHYSGCHAVAWDAGAGPTGDRSIGDSYSRHAYPASVVVNREGRRFLDEGADFQTYTYAKYGAAILDQPGQAAFQIFDQQVAHLIRGDYKIKEATRFVANTLEELATKMEVPVMAFVKEIEEYNAAVQIDVPFNYSVLDGRGATGLATPKTNWANTLSQPPYQAFPVTTGITFTFGGVRIDTSSQVISQDGLPIEGLYAAGEMVGGLYYNNYGSGSGLTAGALFGRRAGYGAAGFDECGN